MTANDARLRKRRAFLKALGTAAAATALPQCFTVNLPAASRNTTPNVVFILADDLGWAELGCYGNDFNETPNLDALARRAMRFTDAYSAAPVCSPFRAALMTGQWPARLGITDYLRPADAKHLSTDCLTLAELFKRAGYATGIIGKWHLTGYANHGAEEFPPGVHGFDEVIVSENRGIGGGSYFYPYHFNRRIKQRIEPTEYLVDRCNLEAVEFIQRHKSRPFFLYLSHYAVHTRLVGKPDLVAKYSKKPGAGKDNRAPINNVHLAAQLESIDHGVGMILETLRRLGLARRTIVVFTSDNGGEDRVTSNGPLRAGKSTLYEGGIRVPLIIHWPGLTRPGSICTAPVSTVDFYPTFGEILGQKPEPGQVLDGLSLAGLLSGRTEKLERQALYWHYPLEKPHFLGGRSSGAIRLGDWKLIEFFDDGRCELYNLADDLSEKKDLAAAMPAKVLELRKRLARWRAAVGAKDAQGAAIPP